MKFLIILLILNIFKNDIQCINIPLTNWGDSIKTITYDKLKQNFTIIELDTSNVTYKYKMDSSTLTETINYFFINEELAASTNYINLKHSQWDNCYKNFINYKDLLIKKIGSPYDSTYFRIKNSESSNKSYSESIQSGELIIEYKWKIQKTETSLFISLIDKNIVIIISSYNLDISEDQLEIFAEFLQ